MLFPANRPDGTVSMTPAGGAEGMQRQIEALYFFKKISGDFFRSGHGDPTHSGSK